MATHFAASNLDTYKLGNMAMFALHVAPDHDCVVMFACEKKAGNGRDFHVVVANSPTMEAISADDGFCLSISGKIIHGKSKLDDASMAVARAWMAEHRMNLLAFWLSQTSTNDLIKELGPTIT